MAKHSGNTKHNAVTTVRYRFILFGIKLDFNFKFMNSNPNSLVLRFDETHKILSSVPLELFLYIHEIYYVIMWIIMIIFMAYKGINIIYLYRDNVSLSK